MILYLDASALVKRYVQERGSEAVSEAIAMAQLTGTALLTRAEVAAALAKAIRTSTLTADEALSCLGRFRTDWPRLVRAHIGEATVARAEQLAWQHKLRGYDAVHLAAAVLWQEGLGESVTLATFDQQLWHAALHAGLKPYPADLTAMLAR
jgi:predicted nucleic acid-binding protein